MSTLHVKPDTTTHWDELWHHAANRNLAVGPSFRHKLRILSTLITKYRVGGRVLDAACGTGELLSLLSGCTSDLTGVDISKTALEITGRRLPRVKCHSLDLEAGKLPETFDSVFCTNALEEIKDDRAALANLSGMLKPEGLLFLIVPHGARYWTQKDNYAGNQRRYERDELKGKLEAAGLHVVETVIWGWPVYRLWYRTMNTVKQEAVWKDETLSRFARLVSAIAYAVLRFDDIFWNSPRGSILTVVARKQGKVP